MQKCKKKKNTAVAVRRKNVCISAKSEKVKIHNYMKTN